MNSKRTPVLPKINVITNNNDNYKIKTKTKCRNCKKYFDPENNSNCWYHSGNEITDGLRVYNQYDEVRYSCCGAIQQGYGTIYKEAIGCKFNDKHIEI